jgi:hypothetical protein
MAKVRWYRKVNNNNREFYEITLELPEYNYSTIIAYAVVYPPDHTGKKHYGIVPVQGLTSMPKEIYDWRYITYRLLYDIFSSCQQWHDILVSDENIHLMALKTTIMP